MSPVGHEMILASAGSGKTHALTHRLVRLLAAGAPPERVVALTFTRKAAGEFFDAMVDKLAAAAADPAQARTLAREIGTPDLTTSDFLRLLRGVIDTMPRLCLGTLDGFFARIVRAFPLELGLVGDFQILEETRALQERRRVLRRMFAASGRPGAAQLEFIEAFKRATFGNEEKRLGSILDRFLDAHAEKFVEAPEEAQWGRPEKIWPDGCGWLGAARERENAVPALQRALQGERLDGGQRGRLDDFFTALADWSPGALLPKPVEYLLKNAFSAWPELAVITLDRRKTELSMPTRRALRQVIEGIVGAELGRRLEMTQGLFVVLRGYERTYHETVRRAGKLTFADLLQLLRPELGAPRLSGGSGEADERRLAINWRLDGQFDHWLLDEFQDTSRAQWSVLRDLIDEAVQDPERSRSFFYVGDAKQAIFSWRGGDPRLFREIFDNYNQAAPGLIAERRLDASWRSGPAVIAMVNRVFGRAMPWQHLVPAGTVERWIREWRDHDSARPSLIGYAAWRQVADAGSRFAETLRIVQEIEPRKRGLDVAVLVRTNEMVAEMVEYLRVGGVPAVAEADRGIATDNPVNLALLALLRAAAHPGDSLAQQHLSMTPLGSLLAEARLGSADAFSESVLRGIHEEGFTGVLERWLDKLEPLFAGNAFARERGRTLVAIAMEFDASGSREVGEFLDFAASYAQREVDAVSAGVRVMTIHKAKGLGFDAVILPDLEDRSLGERREGLGIQRTADQSVEWVLDLPTKMISERDPVLAKLLAREEEEAAYENLCLLYVAMTRAKRAMYVVAEAAAASSSARTHPRLLQAALGTGWAEGEPAWYTDLHAQAAPIEATSLAPWPGDGLAPRPARRVSRTPSGLEATIVTGAQLFALDRAATSDFGHRVHALFAEVEWGTAADWEAKATAWAGHGAAGDEVLSCLRASGLADLWARPERAEVWREKPFEVVLDGLWVTGVFDRVVLKRDPKGRAVSALVLDYKTDRVSSEGDIAAAILRHGAQLNLYRRVVSVLAGIPVRAVTCELLLTRLRRRVPIPRP